jgi:hypothetical protein
MYACMLTGWIANGAVTAAILSDPELGPLGLVLAAGVSVQALGILLIPCGGRRIGARMALIASIMFVPVGLIGALGARRVLDALSREEFEARRTET